MGGSCRDSPGCRGMVPQRALGGWWLLWKWPLCGARAAHSEEPCQAADRGRQEPFEVEEREMPSPTPREEQLYSPALAIWILNKHFFMAGLVTH